MKAATLVFLNLGDLKGWLTETDEAAERSYETILSKPR